MDYVRAERLGSLALFLIAASLTMLATTVPAFAQDHHDAPITGSIRVERGAHLKALAKITPEQARKAALSRMPDATIKEIELDREDGYLVYDVDLISDGEGQEVLIDAGNGAVLRTEADDEDAVEEDEGKDGDEAVDEDEDKDEAMDADENDDGGKAMDEDDDQDGERRGIDLPGAVKHAFQSTYPNAKILGTAEEHDHGQRFIEIESRDGLTRRDLLYSPDGTLREIEEEVSTGQLPGTVLHAAESKGEILKAERITRGQTILFEVTIRMNHQTRELQYDANGVEITASGVQR